VSLVAWALTLHCASASQQRELVHTEVPASTPRTVLEDPEALRALRSVYGEQQVVALAAARSGSRFAIIGWPVFAGQSTAIQSDNSVGTTLDLTPEGRYVVVSFGWNPRDRTGRALLSALGATQYQTVGQPEGAPLAELPQRIESLFAAFSQATRERNQPQALQIIRAMTQLFEWHVTAFGDVLTEMLWAASSGRYTLRHRATQRINDTTARIVAVVNYRGREVELAVTATARRDNPALWLISAEESQDNARNDTVHLTQ
jgi:hypothetical protein